MKDGLPRDTWISLTDSNDMFRELGERLRSYRVDAGFQIAELAERTRISPRYVQALENGRIDLLPGYVFVKGFIRSICAELDRDPEPLLEIVERAEEEETAEEKNGSNDSRKVFPLFLTTGVLLVLVIGGIFLHGGGEKESNQNPSDVYVSPEAILETLNGPDSFSALGENHPEELDLVIRAIEKTWLRIQSDSSQSWETTMKTGDEIRLKGMERVSLFIGNAGGILFELNGKRFGPPGSRGQVISNYVITRDNL